MLKHARAPLERLPNLAAQSFSAPLHALDRLGLLHHAPQSLLVTRALAAR